MDGVRSETGVSPQAPVASTIPNDQTGVNDACPYSDFLIADTVTHRDNQGSVLVDEARPRAIGDWIKHVLP